MATLKINKSIYLFYIFVTCFNASAPNLFQSLERHTRPFVSLCTPSALIPLDHDNLLQLGNMSSLIRLVSAALEKPQASCGEGPRREASVGCNRTDWARPGEKTGQRPPGNNPTSFSSRDVKWGMLQTRATRKRGKPCLYKQTFICFQL